MTLDQQVILSRLAFIRYLYGVAVEQSRRPSPRSAVSVLTFHDTVELFLHLAAQHLDVVKRDRTFLGYWDAISPALTSRGSNSLPHRASMAALNEMRVRLKHHGVPSLDAESFRINTTNFLRDATPLVFGVQFEEVSLADLIRNEQARADVRAAEVHYGKGENEEAVARLAVALHRVFDDFAGGRGWGRPQRMWGIRRVRQRDIEWMASRTHWKSGGFTSESVLERAIEYFLRVTDELRVQVEVLGAGINYHQYQRFIDVAPEVMRTMDGEYHVTWTPQFGTPLKPTVVDVEFCHTFVIEAALALQGSEPPRHSDLY